MVMDGFINIDYNEIAYFPDCEPNYMIVAGLNLDVRRRSKCSHISGPVKAYASE